MFEFKLCCGLASAERDDAPHRVVRRDANRYPIARNDFDTKAAHAAAELREHFVARVALDAVEPAAMDGYNGSLHVNKIVLAQTARFLSSCNCVTDRPESVNLGDSRLGDRLAIAQSLQHQMSRLPPASFDEIPAAPIAFPV